MNGGFKSKFTRKQAAAADVEQQTTGVSERSSPSIDGIQEPVAAEDSRTEPVRRYAADKASFTTQAKALFRKNASYQARNRRTNIRIFAIPIGFCVLLAILQAVINNALDTDDTKCGCKCLYCCDDRSGTDVCRRATDSDPCIPGQFSSCKEQDKTQCGLAYSNSNQAIFCAITEPASWPAFLQVPEEEFRAYEPAAALLYTGANQTTANALAGLLIGAPTLSGAAASQAQTYLAGSQGTLGQGLEAGEAFSVLGVTAATPSTNLYNVYIEGAFVNATAIYNIVPSCANDTSTPALNQLVSANSASSQFITLPFNCTPAQPAWVDSTAGVERQLFCGFKQARCNSAEGFLDIKGISQAWDFGSTLGNFFDLKMWFNNSDVLQAGQQPPPYVRVNKGLNLATNAFLKWALGSNYTATLDGIMEMPKPGSKLTLDFSSLLGPLFFCWLLELLLPVMVVQLVTEKEKKLRIMMKMHGLGDGAYWVVMYAWFGVVYAVYALVLIAFGSAINLKFFRLTDYAFTVIFFLVWGFTLISTAFLASVFFTNPKTALVSTYLYVFATGLLGSLLLGTYMGLDRWWVNITEVVPAFALFRGLYVMGMYAFVGAYSNSPGLQLSDVNKNGNGLVVVFIILLVEAVLFLILAWYLEQVLPTGAGVRRHPLFFLPSKFQPKARRARQQAAVTALGRRVSLDGGSLSSEENGKASFAEEGADVAAERARVEDLQVYSDQAIVMRDLCKLYPAQDRNPPKLAVRALSLAVARGECFGLLGPNGAGKSSAIHMLVGLQEPTSGAGYVNGLSLRDDMQLIYSQMGVCPQHDLLWDMLTPREHLLFYGRLKNLRGPELLAQIEKGLRSVNLWERGVADKRVAQFSGGMKRRLSVAIALIGEPSAVYMDEPSTGLDPASRRNLWNVVKKAKPGRGIILTTHSMEEAEVLCDRLGIFVDGQLVCLGSPKELTARYGEYLVFTITTPEGSDEDAAGELVRHMSPGAQKTYGLAGTQKFELPTSEVTIGSVFAEVERAKRTMTILDWGISSATLEEVFIKFARRLGVEGGA